MKWVSVLGDSVSTFDKFNPQGYAVFYDKKMQEKHGLDSVDDTWWFQVILGLGGVPCVNNSYSGSKVSGKKFPAASCDARLSNLGTKEQEPDIILVYIGFNDFGNGVDIYKKGIRLPLRKDVSTFFDAYEHMLVKIRHNYPNAKIVCGTLMRSKIRNKANWVFPERYAGIGLEEYNDAIRKICKKRNVAFADLAKTDMTYETLDGSHPTKYGHQTLAFAWLDCLETLGFQINSKVEFSIAAYNKNKGYDKSDHLARSIAAHMVFSYLATEGVFMPFDANGELLYVNVTFFGVPISGDEIIPIFTSRKRTKEKNRDRLKPVFLRDIIQQLLRAKRTIVINPHSERELQFAILYEDMVQILLPLMDGREVHDKALAELASMAEDE